jgi:hypothetical protein
MQPALSTDQRTGSSRLQPIYDAGPLYSPLAEALEADWPTTRPGSMDERRIRALEARFDRWRRAKDEINADIRAAYLRRLEEVGREIAADRRKQMLADLDAQQAVYAAADAAENQRYLDSIVAARQTREADWKKQALARLARATKEINADIVASERKLFGVRK